MSLRKGPPLPSLVLEEGYSSPGGPLHVSRPRDKEGETFLIYPVSGSDVSRRTCRGSEVGQWRRKEDDRTQTILTLRIHPGSQRI